jgi:hypothetical protein
VGEAKPKPESSMAILNHPAGATRVAFPPDNLTSIPFTPMPQGDKSSYTGKQKRQAAHIEKSYERQGLGEKAAAGRAWATVNKLTGGGKLRGSGRKTG